MGLVLAFLGALFPLAIAMLVIGAIVWPLVADAIESVEERVAD